MERREFLDISDAGALDAHFEMLRSKSALVSCFESREMDKGGSCFNSPLEDSSTETHYMYFHYAASGDLSKLKSMLESKISINVADYNGRTALHLGAERGHTDIVLYLLAKRADIRTVDVFGNTPLQLAQVEKQRSAEDALKQAERRRSQIFRKQDPTKLNIARFALMEQFPRVVADALLEGRPVEPILKDMVTVSFTEILGLSDLKRSMQIEKVSTLLAELFSKMDKLAYVHGVQQVDIINDVYVAATNFSEDQGTSHAARMARFAVEVMRLVRETASRESADEAHSLLQARVGMHSGPVSGCLLGSHGFKFTLLGDTVNMASRMQTTGLPNLVQCSEAAAQLIRAQASDVLLRPRETEVLVKGKGHHRTFWAFRVVDSLRRRSISCPTLLDMAHRSSPSAHGPPEACPHPPASPPASADCGFPTSAAASVDAHPEPQGQAPPPPPNAVGEVERERGGGGRRRECLKALFDGRRPPRPACGGVVTRTGSAPASSEGGGGAAAAARWATGPSAALVGPTGAAAVVSRRTSGFSRPYFGLDRSSEIIPRRY